MLSPFKRRKEHKLRAEQHRQAIAELRQLTDALPNPDGVIQLDGLRQFLEFAEAHQIDQDEVSDLWSDVRLGLAQGGVFIKTETTLLLKPHETPLFEAQVWLLKDADPNPMLGYAGAPPQAWVVLGSRRLEAADTGTLSVTNHRVVYRGSFLRTNPDPRIPGTILERTRAISKNGTTLEFPLAELVTINVFSGAIALGVTSRQAISWFGTGHPELIVGIIHAAINHADEEPKLVELQAPK